MKKALKITLNVLAWILLILALLITILVFSSGRNDGVSNLFGFIPMTVESASMEPTFKVNDMIICKEVDDVNTLQEGDVITFWTMIEGARAKNTHRIVSIIDNGGSLSFVTRGDNNGTDDDAAVPAKDVIAKWTGVRLPLLGKVMNFLTTKTGFFCIIVIPLALFFLFELYKFIATLIEIKKPKLSESDEEEIKRRAIEEYLASQKAAAGESGETEDKQAEPEDKKAEPEDKQAEPEEKQAEPEEKTAEPENKPEETSAEETPEEPSEADGSPEEKTSDEKADE